MNTLDFQNDLNKLHVWTRYAEKAAGQKHALEKLCLQVTLMLEKFSYPEERAHPLYAMLLTMSRGDGGENLRKKVLNILKSILYVCEKLTTRVQPFKRDAQPEPFFTSYLGKRVPPHTLRLVVNNA